MYVRMIRNDVGRSPTTTVITMLFVAAAAALVSLAAILVVTLPSAIDTLMSRSKTPHFMQMHSGQIDRERMAVFAAQQEAVEDHQVIEFLNIDGSEIAFEGQSLAGSVQDNGFSVPSERFDLLLDLDGGAIEAVDGQVWVPIPYMGLAEVGDELVVAGTPFTVAGFLRDSQMNSMLSSSKRFLVSDGDLEKLREHGSVEYLIEFRLTDLAALGAFQNDYAAAGLEANGPTITYPLFRTLNAISDGLMVALLLLVSGLVIVIAFLCIRFTLLAKVEEDYREIGVLKAIGLRVRDIKGIYLAKYAAIAGVGAGLGLALSLALRGVVLDNIRLYMGPAEDPARALIVGAVGVALVFLAILGYVNLVLRRFRGISTTEAIRFGKAADRPARARRLRLSGNRVWDTNVFLGIKDVLARKRLYLTMLAVLVVSAFIVIVPQNLHDTISARSFVSYMGVADTDVRVDVQQARDITGTTEQVAAAMGTDPAIARSAAYLTKAFQVLHEDGRAERIRVELGDHSAFPLAYAQGRAPASDDEIALSVMNASELGKAVGDPLTVIVEGQARDLTVSGVYSDVTNGGRTAKAMFAAPAAEVSWGVVIAELADSAAIDATVAAYTDRFGEAKISSIDEFVAQTYGGTVRSVGVAATVSLVVALALAGLITLLFIKMLVAKDRYSIATMKALGFRNSDIRIQYAARALLVTVVGIVLGTVLANTVGQVLAGQVIATFGAASFAFVVDPLRAYLLSPALMAIAVLAATYFGTSDTRRATIADNIKE